MTTRSSVVAFEALKGVILRERDGNFGALGCATYWPVGFRYRASIYLGNYLKDPWASRLREAGK